MVVLGLALMGCSDRPSTSHGPLAESAHRDYLGRYRLNDDLVLVVSDQNGLLTLLPSFWRTALILEPVAGDRFRSPLHSEIEMSFHRDADGRVSELGVSGNEEIDGRARRLAPGERLPAEALLDGGASEALRLLDLTGEESPDRALGLARQLLLNFPTRDAAAAGFLGGIAERFPDSAAVEEARGVAWVRAGDREKALVAFRRAVEFDKEISRARLALGHLDPELARPEAEGWRVPFALADLFRAPTAEEIRRVRQA